MPVYHRVKERIFSGQKYRVNQVRYATVSTLQITAFML